MDSPGKGNWDLLGKMWSKRGGKGEGMGDQNMREQTVKVGEGWRAREEIS